MMKLEEPERTILSSEDSFARLKGLQEGRDFKSVLALNLAKKYKSQIKLPKVQSIKKELQPIGGLDRLGQGYSQGWVRDEGLGLAGREGMNGNSANERVQQKKLRVEF